MGGSVIPLIWFLVHVQSPIFSLFLNQQSKGSLKKIRLDFKDTHENRAERKHKQTNTWCLSKERCRSCVIQRLQIQMPSWHWKWGKCARCEGNSEWWVREECHISSRGAAVLQLQRTYAMPMGPGMSNFVNFLKKGRHSRFSINLLISKY